MKRTLIIALAVAGCFAMGSCRKSWTCQCKNANGAYDAGTIEDARKHQAKKSCEGLSTADTQCALK